MITKKFQDKPLSLLGFGTMRLPVKADGTIDEAKVAEMAAYAMAHGVNYFDTAWPYHGGESEKVIGRVLKAYPRNSWYLADKFPGHQISTKGFDPAATFEAQLEKCGVEYFDFYLLHNVHENSVANYLDPRWGIIDYLKEQKKLGRIKHLGFSTHAEVKGLEEFLDLYGKDMEFCQIQLNYLDWTLQYAKEKYELLTKWNIPVWVMEPVRGGKLAKLPEQEEAKLKALRPEESTAAWGFRFLQGLDNVTMILSGMSNLEQMMDNVKTFSEAKPLSSREESLLLELAEGMKASVPCTGCRYCCDGCPAGLDIPFLLRTYNELRFAADINAAIRIEFLPEDKKPSQCIGCGQCTQMCPQNIDVPGALQDLAHRAGKMPSWKEICRQRELAAEKG